MACGGCSAARAASAAAAKAFASGDQTALQEHIATLDAIAAGTFAANPIKRTVTRSVQAALVRLAGKTR